MHIADAPTDELQGETDCCGFNVYPVVVLIVYIYMKYSLNQLTQTQKKINFKNFVI